MQSIIDYLDTSEGDSNLIWAVFSCKSTFVIYLLPSLSRKQHRWGIGIGCILLCPYQVLLLVIPPEVLCQRTINKLYIMTLFVLWNPILVYILKIIHCAIKPASYSMKVKHIHKSTLKKLTRCFWKKQCHNTWTSTVHKGFFTYLEQSPVLVVHQEGSKQCDMRKLHLSWVWQRSVWLTAVLPMYLFFVPVVVCRHHYWHTLSLHSGRTGGQKLVSLHHLLAMLPKKYLFERSWYIYCMLIH